MKTTSSYITYWPADWVKTILKNGDSGPLSVIYGGPHRSQPSLGKIGPGDSIYPVTLAGGRLYVLACMTVCELVDADEYIKQLRTVSEPAMWDIYTAQHQDTITHCIPRTCADKAAIGRGTPIAMRPFPAEAIPLIRLGPKPGAELPLKMRGNTVSINNFSGYFRRMSTETAALFDQALGAGGTT